MKFHFFCYNLIHNSIKETKAMSENRMNIVCLDMEGVLVPEIWIAFAEESGIPELKRTTRDEPNYDKLMEYRLAGIFVLGNGISLYIVAAYR